MFHHALCRASSLVVRNHSRRHKFGLKASLQHLRPLFHCGNVLSGPILKFDVQHFHQNIVGFDEQEKLKEKLESLKLKAINNANRLLSEFEKENKDKEETPQELDVPFEEDESEELIPKEQLPKWFRELTDCDKMKNFMAMFPEVKWYDQGVRKSFQWSQVSGKNNREVIKDDSLATEMIEQDKGSIDPPYWYYAATLPSAEKYVLSTGKGKKFILVGEGLGMADYRDLPIHTSVIHPSYFWIEDCNDEISQSSQPKMLFQFNRCLPPLLWTPLKPTVDAIQRLFLEIISIEKNYIEKYENFFDKAVGEIDQNISYSVEELQKRIIDFSNNECSREEISEQDYPNVCHLFMGHYSDEKLLENFFLDNPFIFSTPIILGSQNKYFRSKNVKISKFRTILSRSIISVEIRHDFKIEMEKMIKSYVEELTDGKMKMMEEEDLFPVFIRINYPTNVRLSKPAASRMNKIFKTDYPDDIPVDVIAALFGAGMKSASQILQEFNYMLEDPNVAKSDSENLLPIPFCITYLASLRYGNFSEIFKKFSTSINPVERMACVKGACELGMIDKIKEVDHLEKDERIKTYIQQILKHNS